MTAIPVVEPESNKGMDTGKEATTYPAMTATLRLTEQIRLKNRAYFAPMGIDVASDDGRATPELIDFYRNVIAGGAGMVVLGNATVDPASRLHQRGLCLYEDEHAEALRPLFELGRQHHCEVVVQLQHYGAQGSTQLTATELMSPSGIACQRMSKKDPDYKVVAMTQMDINRVKRHFVRAAGLVWQAGGRMVQLQASNGYLLSSFLSPYTNKRTDDYGGTGHKRMQMLCEVVHDIRQAYPELAISVRLGIDDGLSEQGQKPELIAPHLHRLEELGVAALTLSVSIGETFELLVDASDEARQRMASGVRLIRRYCSLPLGFAGLIDGLDSAEQARLELGVDLVGMTRALFADNDLINKSLAGQHQQIHRCRFDGNCFRDKSNPAAERVFCCVNPRYLRPDHIVY